MTSVENLVIQQGELLTLVKKQFINFNKDSPTRKTKGYYKQKFATLGKHYTQFHTNHSEIILQIDGNHKYIKNEFIDVFEDTYLDSYSKIQDAFDQTYEISSSSPAVEPTQVQHNAVRRLPKLEIPFFSGDCTQWPSFYDAFKTVHNDATLSAAHKFQYLKGLLSGEAELLIRYLPITSDNYEKALNELDKNYNNKRIIFSQQMTAFMNQKELRIENSNDIRQLLSFSRATMHVINSLGVPASEPIFVYIVLQKLPAETKTFCLHHFDPKAIPLWEHLENAIEIRLNSLPYVINEKENKSNVNSSFTNSKSKSVYRKSNTYHVSNSPKCLHCNSSHSIRECSSFLEHSPAQRKVIVEKLKACYNCLSSTHILSKCPSKFKCRVCKQKHHSLLHLHNEATSPQAVPSNSDSLVVHATSLARSSRQVLLATAIVRVRARSGEIIALRAFLDPGAQATLISSAAAHQLNLPKRAIKAQISGIGDTPFVQGKSLISIDIHTYSTSEFVQTTEAIVLNKLTAMLPSHKIDHSHWDHIQNLTLADPTFDNPGRIDLLLGADVCANVQKSGLVRGALNQPIAQNTIFGWILYGEIPQAHTKSVNVNLLAYHTQVEIDTTLRKFWELEEVPSTRTISKADQWCETFFQQTHRRSDNGKYMVRLPFKTYEDSTAVLGTSMQSALRRFHLLEKRFLRDPQLHCDYSNVINEYKLLGQLEEESSREIGHTNQQGNVNCCYLPHHPVLKESSSSTKLRVVFDASAKTSNQKSLNDILHIGPTLQTDLTSIILNWRLLKYVFTSDIEKMYRRIDMHPEDTHYQRILWRDNPTAEVKTYRLNTVTFGTASAPYTAIRVMHQLACDETKNYPLASEVITTQMYVDDILSGSHSIESAYKIQHELINCLKSAHFELRKWSSNCSQLLKAIPPEHRESKTDFHINSDESIKALGLFWKPSTDHFHYVFKVDESSNVHTKRTVLSTIARLFDPLGWINPIIIAAKIFLKHLWCAGLDWDQSLPKHLTIKWQLFLSELQNLHRICIPRWIHTNTTIISYQLHSFSDGSLHAYSATTYLRIVNKQNQISTHLLMAKCKVTPKKQLTIPRVELCGAVLASKLHKHIQSSLRLQFGQPTHHFWTDSTIVLAWIKGDPDRWKTFVSNRIYTILDNTNISQWRHVRTADNPADLSSRGVSIDDLHRSNLWWHGPTWLQQQPSDWPINDNSTLDETTHNHVELKSKYTIATTTLVNSQDFLIPNYSSYTRLIRITAWCLRFITNCRQKSHENRSQSSFISTNEYTNALIILHKLVQHCFAVEISLLRSKQQLPSKNKLIGLNPFIDTDGVLRVGGRLRNSNLSFSEKHPILLPSDHHFTSLILNYSHSICLHGGTQLTLNQIRKIYWIINAKRITSNYIKSCITCVRNRPKLMTQLMGDLPHVRVRPSRPFSATGVDYAGPINFRVSKGRGNKSYKGYIAVFICLSTKAIHLEAVSDLTTSAFLAALHRFFSRRGLAHDMYSDCGTTFIGANNQLKQDEARVKKLFEKHIIPHLVERTVNWHFIPPFSPHFGGLWEAGVKSVKHHLRRIVPNSTLTFEEITTVLCRIEACLNSRPLCPLSDSYDDLTALTPGHFIIGDTLLSPPEIPTENLLLTNRWHQLQKIHHDFWSIWSREYLSRLQSRPKWNQTNLNIAVGDLVVIKDDHLPANQWKLGRITALHPGSDNLTRVVSVKTSSGIVKRPLVKICKLPSHQVYTMSNDNNI